jgi:hypothetical protein
MPCRTRRTAVEALCAARPDPGASPDIRVTATESPARFSSPCRCAVVDVRSGQKLQLCTARPFRSVVRWSGRSEAPALHGSSFPVGGAVVGEVRSSSSARPVLSTSSSGGLVQKLQLCMAGPLYVEVRWSGRSEAPALHDSFLSGRGAVVGDFRSSSSARCVLSLWSGGSRWSGGRFAQRFGRAGSPPRPAAGRARRPRGVRDAQPGSATGSGRIIFGRALDSSGDFVRFENCCKCTARAIPSPPHHGLEINMPYLRCYPSMTSSTLRFQTVTEVGRQIGTSGPQRPDRGGATILAKV